MNGWLVLARCATDDIPMRMFADYQQARDFARSVTPDDVIETAPDVLDVTVSHVICVCLVEFVNGWACPASMVRDFEEPGYEVERI